MCVCSVWVSMSVLDIYTHNYHIMYFHLCAHVHVGDVGGYTRAMVCGRGFQEFHCICSKNSSF